MTNSLILAFVGDLFFSMRIESVIEKLGFNFKLIERADEIAVFDPNASDRQPGEHIDGQGAVLTRKIAEWQPGLMIFDLNNREIPWQEWIALLRSSPATRRIPVLCFGSHMDVETMKRAKEVGASAVVARSRFTSDMAGLIKKHLRTRDTVALETACQQPLSDLALEGIRLHNAGEYFEAHEVLEEAWNADESAAKELYRAILQVAVAYLQIERENYRGAVKMFLRVRQWIDPLPDVCRGVDVAQLRVDAYRVEAELLALGKEGIKNFDRGMFQPVVVHEV